MPNEKHSADEMTPALRKALVESGAVIPTTPNEVKLAEIHLSSMVSSQKIKAAFAKLEKELDNDSSTTGFMSLDQSILAPAVEGLAMAARNGSELDAETMQKIKESISRATGKPPRS